MDRDRDNLRLTKPSVGMKVRHLGLFDDPNRDKDENIGRIGTVIPVPPGYNDRVSSKYLDVKFDKWRESDRDFTDYIMLYEDDSEFEVLQDYSD